MPLPEVKCNVNTCAYWVTNDLCRAGNIAIDRTPAGAAVPGKAYDTCCATFNHFRGTGQFLASLANTNWAGLVREPFRPGWQMSPAVECGVHECLHWRSGAPGQPNGKRGGCSAASIQVTGNGATLLAETGCATFVPRSPA